MKKKVLFCTLFIPLLIVSLIACAPGSAEPQEASGQNGSTEVVAWSEDSDCAVCHDTIPTTGDLLSLVHEAEGYDCYTCHDKNEITAVHEERGDSGRMPTKLKHTSISNEDCSNSVCHANMDEIIAATADVQMVDSKGTSVNPHETLSVVGHETLQCKSCHVMHKEHDVIETSEKTCTSCHHQNVYECGTCHE